MKKLIILLFLSSCASNQVARFELPPEENYIYYETSSQDVFFDMVKDKIKNNNIIHDPSNCVKDKTKLPRKEHILEDMRAIGADSVLVINVVNGNGKVEDVDGKLRFGYQAGYYCKSAAFFKKR